MIAFAIYLKNFRTKMTRTYIRKTQTTYTEEQLQHFTERLEDNLKNVLQRHHADTQ